MFFPRVFTVFFALYGLHCLCFAPKYYSRFTSKIGMTMNIDVMVNGLPGPMAMEVAKCCLDRGYNLVPSAFTGSGQPAELLVEGVSKSQKVSLHAGPGIEGSKAESILTEIKAKYPNVVVVDYTHPSAVLNNLKCYVDNNCEFVMGTTGVSSEEIEKEFAKGTNFAVIAPNMAKQVVAMQSALLEMSKRFPGSFDGYKLTVSESHQSTKADTSGTAKAVVSHLATLNGEEFDVEDIVRIRDEESQLAFKVPSDALKGHAFHTYRLTSDDGSTSFELQHNVCGRRIYAEGTVDAVSYIADVKQAGGSKRLHNMIDVLEAGKMN